MAKTIRELMDEVRREIDEVSVEDVHDKLGNGATRPVLIDIREREEFNQGHLPDAVYIPRGYLELRVEREVPDKSTPVVVYCARGRRSLLAARALRELGYSHVASLAGGFTRWKEKGYDFRMPNVLSDNLRQRYDRHLRIPEVGEAGQLKLVESKVLLVGSGALGSPAALYLAAAGVGTMGIVDSDVVDESNLQRQILHSTPRVGTPKVDSAADRIGDLNPNVTVRKHHLRLDSSNAVEIFSDYDVIVDGSDNFPTRYLVNDVCVMLKKPCVHGSIFRFEGQATVFHPPEGPCYRCLYPEPPPPELAPNCDEAGVLGVLPGVIGCIEATEAIKVLLGIGTPLIGRILAYDALHMSFREYRVRRDPDCPVCADGAQVELIDYEWFCSAEARH